MSEAVSSRPLWIQIASAGALSVFLGLIIAISPMWIQNPPQSTFEWAALEGLALILVLLGLVGLVVAARVRRGGNIGGFARAFADNFPYSRYAKIAMNRVREQGPAPPRTKIR